MASMTEALAANDAALRGGYCTVANSSDIKCAAPAVWKIVGMLNGKTVTEPVCHEHLADEIEVALTVATHQLEQRGHTGTPYVTVWPA